MHSGTAAKLPYSLVPRSTEHVGKVGGSWGICGVCGGGVLWGAWPWGTPDTGHGSHRGACRCPTPRPRTRWPLLPAVLMFPRAPYTEGRATAGRAQSDV
eukprot:83773-Prymnesium_polylepis.1